MLRRYSIGLVMFRGVLPMLILSSHDVMRGVNGWRVQIPNYDGSGSVTRGLGRVCNVHGSSPTYTWGPAMML